MPDVRQAQKFMRLMTEVEENYLRDLRRLQRETRRNLLDILERNGTSRLAVEQMQVEIKMLKRRVEERARLASKRVREVTKNYTAKQIEIARRVMPVRVDVGQITAEAAQLAADGEQEIMTSAPAWIGQLATSLQTGMSQMRLSQTPQQDAIARLLSEDIVDGRASAWHSSVNAAELEERRNIWQYAIGLTVLYLTGVNKQSDEVQFQKQAIATIDENTTECCLKVHGQIQPFDEPFHLTGTPRFADYLQNPPFHWNCRTSVALYNEAFEEFGIPTSEMVDAAQAELEARAKTGKRVPIYPSHATARRK